METSHLKFVDESWLNTAEGQLSLQQLYSFNRKLRKNFGLLEQPSISPEIPEISFKIGVIGKAGSGKSKAMSFLCGKATVFPGYIETIGIHVKNLYWPAQLHDKSYMFKLQFWESGECCSKRFHYISSACLENADAIAIVVNNTDKSSLEYVDSKLELLNKEKYQVVLFVIVSEHNVQISDQELRHYATSRKLPSFHLPPHIIDLNYFVPFFNSFCDFLYTIRNDSNETKPYP